MKKALAALFGVQEVDSAIMKTQRKLQALDPGTAEKSVAESATVMHERLAQEHQQTIADLHDAELELKSVEAKKKDYEDRLYGGKIKGSAKELEAVQEEILALGRQRAKLDDRILALMDLVELRKTEDHDAAEKRKTAEEALAAKQAEFAAASAALKDRIRKLNALRAERASTVPPALLKRYDSIRVAKGGLAIGKIDDKLCGSCHTSLPSNLIRLVEIGETVETCENCGRMLCMVDPS